MKILEGVLMGRCESSGSLTEKGRTFLITSAGIIMVVVWMPRISLYVPGKSGKLGITI